MNIELRGVKGINKGAELMLQTILNTIRGRMPDANFVLELTRETTIAEYKADGIYTKLNIVKRGVDSGDIGKYLPSSIRKKYNLISEHDIDVIIDSSGFAFGDFWGARKAGLRMANQVKKWKGQGKKIILLPQAFGPFTDARLRSKMATILEHADLIFARDKYSFEYLKDVSPTYAYKVEQYPDFTNLSVGSLPANHDVEKYQVAIIPNIKMLKASIFQEPDDYYKVLISFINETKARGFKPYFLLHEGLEDEKVIDAVNKQLSELVPVVKEDDPFKIKGVIKSSQAVIGSRFHGLVSSLSQGIPSLCVGWSHKYEALFDDYQFPEGLLSNDQLDQASIKEKMDLIFEPSKRSKLLRVLSESSEKQKELSRKMWERVFEVLA